MRALFRVSVVLIVLMAFPPGTAADDEIAARSLLGEAEKLIELALPQEALPTLDRVQSEYPGTEAALFAGLRRAQALMFLHEYEAASEVATEIVSANPGTMIACWAQCVVGQSLVKLGRTAEGVEALQEVGPMLPDDTDLGPLNEAREVLGRVCSEYVAERRDDLDAAEVMGWDPTDHGAGARVLAMLAVHRARQGDFAAARGTLNKIEILYPTHTAEIAWAKAEIGMYDVREAIRHGTDTLEATDALSLRSAADYTSPQEAARAYLTLPKRHRQRGEIGEAVGLLETARDNYLGTANAAEILYELGAGYYLAGRPAEAATTLQRIAAEWPRSGYAAPALYLVGSRSKTHASASLEALRQLAGEGYPRRWRALASWELAALHRSTDPKAAKRHYQDAIAIFGECLAADRGDTELAGDWPRAVQDLIDAILVELESLPEAGEGTPQ